MPEMRLMWPIVDEDRTRSQLIAEAGALVVETCAAEGYVPIGVTHSWDVVTLPEGGCRLTCVVPVLPLEDMQRGQLPDLFERRYTDAQIAIRLGVSKRTVRRWRAELGLRRVGVLREDPALVEEVRRLHADGLTDHKIAALLQISYTTVWRIRNVVLELAPHGRTGRPKKAV